jgi:hypothetical protein
MKRFERLALVLIVLIGASCGEDRPSGGGGNGDRSSELIVQMASYDLAVGEKGRVILGLLTPDQLLVSFGNVDVEFFFLGTEKGSGTAQPGPEVTAEFLAIPGTDEPAESERPRAVPASQGRGVYAAQVAFDTAGFWAAEVVAEVEDEGRLTGNTVFEVFDEHRVPFVGDPAPKTDNLTLDSKDAPEGAIDSRAISGDIPDPELHRMTVAESLRRGEPAVVVIATPVYCVSRFCGPITDMVADLAARYEDRANFIHIEVWRNFQRRVINKGAADWIYRKGDLQEPWVFLIDAKGKVAARWDNVATAEEIEPLLKKLTRL